MAVILSLSKQVHPEQGAANRLGQFGSFALGLKRTALWAGLVMLVLQCVSNRNICRESPPQLSAKEEDDFISASEAVLNSSQDDGTTDTGKTCLNHEWRKLQDAV